MKALTIYKHAKDLLRSVSYDAKSEYGTDLPAIRQIINDTCYEICRDLHLTEYQQNLLHNYACTLHPKN